VPPEIQDQIFEPFFTTRKKGTGLGLAIVKKNATQLGGCVSLRSPVENGRGAEFRVTLAAPLTSEVRS
jgi:two-component system sensor histidine kinase FlrB